MRVKWLLGCVCAAAIAFSLNANTAMAQEYVTIEDPVLSNTVHDALGLDRSQELTADQLSQITELRIDQAEYQGYYDYRGNCSRQGFCLDLSEIGLIENLESLDIHNLTGRDACRSTIYGMEGLSECKNLKTLKVAYNVNEQSETVSKNVRQGGTKVLEEIVAGCEALETLDLCITPSEEVVSALHAINADLEITGEETASESTPGLVLPCAYGAVLSVQSTEELLACQEPESVTAVEIKGDCDLSALKEMPQVNTLVISGYQMGLQNGTVNVTGFEMIRDLVHLNTLALNMCTVDADMHILDEIEGLRSLGYTNMEEALPEDLAVYGQLREFTYRGATGALKQLTSMKDLRNLTYYESDENELGGLKDALQGSGVRSLTVGLGRRETEDPSMTVFNGLEELRNLCVIGGGATTLTWEGAEGLDKLEVLDVWVKNDFPKDLSIYPQLRRLSLYFTKWTQEDCADTVDLTSASKPEKLSFFGAPDLKASDRMKFDLTVYGRITGLAALHQKGVDIDLLSDPNYADRMIEQLV